MTEESGTAKDLFTHCAQVGVVVRDLDKTLSHLSQIFGLRPFRIVTYPPSDRPDMQRVYRGQPGNFVYRQAFIDLGTIELEIIEPLEGESIWADFIREHGEGIHHIRFNTFDLDAVTQHLAGKGIGVGMMGAGLRAGTFWANFDTESRIGFTIEVMQALPGTDGRTPGSTDGQGEA